MSTTDMVALVSSLYGTLFVLSVLITNFFDTPVKPQPSDPFGPRLWYLIYKTAEMIRYINDRAKQHPEVAIKLASAVAKLESGRAADAKLDIADVITTLGTKSTTPSS